MEEREGERERERDRERGRDRQRKKERKRERKKGREREREREMFKKWFLCLVELEPGRKGCRKKLRKRGPHLNAACEKIKFSAEQTSQALFDTEEAQLALNMPLMVTCQLSKTKVRSDNFRNVKT